MSEGLASITDVFSSLFVLLKRRDDGTYGALAITAAPSLHGPALPFDAVEPGVYRFHWTADEAKQVSMALRKLGYITYFFNFERLQEQFTPLRELTPLAGAQPTYPHLAEIAEYLPECQIYVEVFGGRTPLLMARTPAPVEVFNDYARAAISFFHVLRDPELFTDFYLLGRVLPPSLQLPAFHLFSAWELLSDSDAALASYAWYCYVRQAFPEVSVPEERQEIPDGTPAKVMAALHSVDYMLPRIHNRLYRVQIEHNIIDAVLKIYDSDKTLFWVDPPHEGAGALDLAGTYDLLSHLDMQEGSVALYDNQNPNIRQMMRIKDGPWKNWEPAQFGPATVYLKQCTTDA